MALVQLVDCFNAIVGATNIARPTTFGRNISQEEIVSAGDAVPGDHNIDDGPWGINGSLACQDPMIAPTLAGLTYPLAVYASGRIKGAAATYHRWGILHAVLTGISMEIADKQAGSATFEFANKAAASTTLATEAPSATTVSGPALQTRATPIRILSAQFTPRAGAAIDLLGVDRFSWRAQAMLAPAAHTPGADFIDAVDVVGWRISGSISMLDKTLGSGLTFCQYLATLIRGTITLVCRVSGQAEAAVAPSNITIQANAIKLRNPSEGLNSKGDATGTLAFNAEMRDATTVKALSEMIGAA